MKRINDGAFDNGRGTSPFRWLLLLACMVAGCGRPHWPAKNQRSVEALRTAISARRTDWLDENVKSLEDQHKAGTIPDDEYEILKSIAEMARGGDWTGAREKIMKVEKSQ